MDFESRAIRIALRLRMYGGSNPGDYDSEICSVSGTFLSDGVTIESFMCTIHSARLEHDNAGVLQIDNEAEESFDASNAIGVYPNPDGEPMPKFHWTTGLAGMIHDVHRSGSAKYYDASGHVTATGSIRLTSISFDAGDQDFILTFGKN